jgi:hypothetical protein
MDKFLSVDVTCIFVVISWLNEPRGYFGNIGLKMGVSRVLGLYGV